MGRFAAGLFFARSSGQGSESTAVGRSEDPDAQDCTAQGRGIALALLVSVLLHAPLLLPSGPWRLGRLREEPAPPLLVHIEAQATREPSESSPRESPATGLRPALAEVAELAPEPADATESGDEPDLSAAPGTPATGDVPLVTETPVEPADSPGEPGAAVPTEIVAPSDATVADAMTVPEPVETAEASATDEAVAPADTVVATVGPAEEAAITRRLVREARELLGSSGLRRDLTFKDKDRSFAAVLTRQPAADGTGVERVTAEIVSEQGGERMQTSMQMKRLTFSHFTQLVDRWDTSVQLHDDEIAGRFHSNSQILLTYDRRVAPRLLGKVTTASGIRISEERGWRSRREIFAGGLDTRSARIRFPQISLPLAPEHVQGKAEVHLLQGDTRIVFQPDGDYECIELASQSRARRRLAASAPTYIVGAGDAELQVLGVVNGNVTVYSPKRIVVQGDLTYAQDARSGGADDYLGLVSDGNVEIDRAEVTGPGDLEIHAAVYARRRFLVRDIRSRERATLAIYGSLTAGSLSATEPRYATRIEFDPRFERVRPPGFPETDQYEVESWDGRWRVAGGPSGAE